MVKIPRPVGEALYKVDEAIADAIFRDHDHTISSELAERLDTSTQGVHILLLETMRLLPGFSPLARSMQLREARNLSTTEDLDRALKYASPSTRKYIRKRWKPQ